MKAVIVTAIVKTRMIIDNDTLELTESQKLMAKERLIENLMYDFDDLVEPIEEDIECPYNELYD